MTRAAAGFRAHTGWAAAVVLAGSSEARQVVERRRIELLASGVPWECYHAAASMPRAEAEKMIEKARRTATELAEDELQNMIRQHRISAVGLVLSSARPLLSIDEALSSHAMKHAAEGQLYRQAIIDAATNLGLRVTVVPERDLPEAASRALGLTPAALRGRAGDLGRDIGPPWAADQKTAALVAWLALATKSGQRRKARARG